MTPSSLHEGSSRLLPLRYPHLHSCNCAEQTHNRANLRGKGIRYRLEGGNAMVEDGDYKSIQMVG